MKISIVGGSGYGGGELLRILLTHPKVKIQQVTSKSFVGEPVALLHPNLRGMTDLEFCSINDLKKCDLLFIALPNGISMGFMNHFRSIAAKIIDLGADFRLDRKNWEKWYGKPHTAPKLISKFVYGIPEIYRDEIAKANLVAGPGCEAIVSILALRPLIKNRLISNIPVVIDAKMSSSEAGRKEKSSTHHPERTGVVRSYKPTGHRHTAEVEKVLKATGSNSLQILISATAIEMVRGLLITAHPFLNKNITEKDIWQTYRKEYSDKPFIRIVKQHKGLYRYPEPKILQGTNYCEIGFEIDPLSNRLVVIGAIDNLGKGTAGNAVQCMNLMYGFKETLGLEFPGLHPI